MLKIHSFLHRMKITLSKLLPCNIGKYKKYAAIVSYIMATVLILISPDYIYGTGNSSAESFAKADVLGAVLNEMNEETDNEAVIRVNNNQQPQFIQNDLKTDGTIVFNKNYLVKNPAIQVNSNENNRITDNNKSKEEDLVIQESNIDESKTIEDSKENIKDVDKANSSTDRADASKEVDSSSTKDVLTKNKYVMDLKKEEIEVLQRIVEAEATGEDVKGKILVANVILNRVEDKNFPDTIKEVVFQKDGGTYQFSPIKDKRYWSVEISEDTIIAVDRVMQGEDYSQGALYFSARVRANKNSMKWFDTNLKYLFQYGGHEFFKNK